jgi:NAD-specific glutamate dehydrogenase
VLHVFLNLLVGELATNQVLEGKNRVLGVNHGLMLRCQTDQVLPMFHKCNNRGRRLSTLQVLNDIIDMRGLAFHDGHTRVHCTQINANHWACMRVSQQLLETYANKWNGLTVDLCVHVSRDE